MNKKIINAIEGENLVGAAIVSSVSVAEGKNGNYMNIDIEDDTGKLSCKAWFVAQIHNGDVVDLNLTVGKYNSKKNGIIKSIKVISNPTEEILKEIIPHTPYSIEEMWDQLKKLVDSLSDLNFKAIINELVFKNEKILKVLPAARSMHHDGIGGWLQHTLEMATTADRICPVYKNVLNRDLLISGTIIHDVGKLHEFNTTAYNLVENYSVVGNLQGHLYIGAQMVTEAARKVTEDSEKYIIPLTHMILSHHGNREWGAVQLPAFPEATALFLIDMMSSRLEMYRKGYESLDKGEQAQSGSLGLDSVKIWKHMFAPDD